MSDYAKPEVLVDTDWVEAHLNDDAVRIVEVDEDIAAYDKGHIEGAVGWNWTTDLHTKVGREFVSQAELAGLLSAAGVGPDTTVVLYGGNNNWFAAYAYWILKLRGFDNVKLLNGGRKKWELESRPLTQDVPTYQATGITIAGSLTDPRSAPGATRSSPRSARSGSSMSAHPRSTAGRSSPPITCPRSSPRFPGTSPVRRTSRG